MSEHIWAQEQIASYLSGGLDAAERERLDRHSKDCHECAAALEAAVHFDRGLGTLFLPLRPKPGLEDRAVQAVRVAPKPHAILILGWPRRVTAAVAAIIVLGACGAVTASILGEGGIPLPGQLAMNREAKAPVSLVPDLAGRPADGTERAEVGLAAIQVEELDKLAQQNNAENTVRLMSADPGLNSNLEAGVNLERLRQKGVEDVLKQDAEKVRGLGANTNNDRPAAPFARYSNNNPQGNFTANNSAFNTNELGNNRAFNLNGVMPNGGNGLANSLNGNNAAHGNWSAQNPTQLFSFYTGNFNEGLPQATGGGAVPVNPSNALLGGSQPAQKDGKPAQSGTELYFHPGDTTYRQYGPLKEQVAKTGDKGDGQDPKDSKGKDDNNKPKNGDPMGPPAPVLPPPPPGTSPPAPAADPIVPVVNPEPTRRVVLRSGDIEFELQSFDSGLATITKLVSGIKGAFVGTVNSEKLPNGKVKGSISLRVPPESLDGLVLDLRKELGKGGELKSVRLASQDVTKQYTDTESRLRAARAMETRLLKIIQDGKGEIKQLIEAERELGSWRTKIEEAEGELRYYASHASLSTLTITLIEKEIRAAAEVAESERVQAGVEVEDVDKSYQSVLKEVLDAKGRVLNSELKQLTAGQFNALLKFEVAPESAGLIRDRLRQLGRVARLEIDRQQQAEGGTMPKNAPVKRGDTLFIVQLYNLANIAPRETATISVAVADVPAAYNAIRDAVAKASGRVQLATLNENDKSNVTAQVDFDVRRTEDGSIRAAVLAAGDATSRTVTRAVENDQTTDTKLLYKITLFPVSRLRARDAIGLQLAANDVAATYSNLREAVIAAKGRIIASNLDENDKQNVNASLDFEIRRSEEPALKGALEAAGEVLARQVAHLAENEAATDSKVLYNLRLLPANRLKPRETTVLGLEVADVDQTAQFITSQFNEVKGRQIDAKSGRERNGKATARLVYEVPLASAAGLVERFKNAGMVRALNSSRDPQAPEGKSATARIEVTLANTESIGEGSEGVWPPVKKGLSYSLSVLLTSLTWVVFGLCVVLPWAVIGYGGWRVVKRVTRPTTPAGPPAPPAAEPSHG